MMELPTDPEGFPDEMDLEERDCTGCGTTGYVPDDIHDYRDVRRCADCVREDFREYLDPETETNISRQNALVRLSHRDGLLPIRDPADDATHILVVESDHGPAGSFVKRTVRVIERECPECGHDRLRRIMWRAYTCEHGERVNCPVCQTTVERHDTL